MVNSQLPGSGRTYHDPLHGAIALDRHDPIEALLIQLIDTPAFQRLRRIRQLGPASLTFHGAEGSRFTHSLGVMAIARRAFDRIAHRYPQLKPHRATVLCAALLHDIGHGPFSHTCEEIFGSHHEHWTIRILRESKPVRSRLDAFSPTLLDEIEQVYHKQHPIPLVWQLVSSQLDCDRLDYLMRDSYFTGASYGKLDLDRIILALDYDPVSQQLVVARKGMAAIEHYLIVRYFMYAQIYNHPKNIAASWLLEQAFQRARELLAEGRLVADDTMTTWLKDDCNLLDLTDYLNADDGVFLYHLQRWQQHDDPLLADLCRRLVDRDLLKALDVTHLSPEQQQDLLQKVQQRFSHSPNPTHPSDAGDRYVGLRTTWSRGYTLYHRGIKLKTETDLREISELSPLVQTLTQPWQRTWLLYPRDVDPLQFVTTGSNSE
ncbi:HD domain-containing protein [Oscillatoria sp. FACHB-1407]|uniref:HD domain-containing protein n=1 Tax=Oscillatoria sp. FACHB-1407 TaxID=2692847 RepID=UPI001683EA53|nr:HD domain-containing protein [Oscillatoria sp. FACHB-1407]MBD2460197.1 HD domain-containing protein [Oscillatoria sp. FACHB-1407]